MTYTSCGSSVEFIVDPNWLEHEPGKAPKVDREAERKARIERLKAELRELESETKEECL